MNFLLIIKAGIIFSMLSVIIGAFGAHTLSEMINDKIEVFKTGVQYHMFHAIALIMAGIISKILAINTSTAAYFFIIGIILFSGSLYLISIFKVSNIGIITPIGGVCFIIGWSMLFYNIINS